jgi:uncharacterized protein YfkK (UPF0435 family)
MINQLAVANEETIGALADKMRAKEGVGSSLKTFQASFLESHLAEISGYSVPLQRKIHEFRNQLAILNQDILKANDYMKMTFNPSVGDNNLGIIRSELKNTYNYIQSRTQIAADKVKSICSEM